MKLLHVIPSRTTYNSFVYYRVLNMIVPAIIAVDETAQRVSGTPGRKEAEENLAARADLGGSAGVERPPFGRGDPRHAASARAPDRDCHDLPDAQDPAGLRLHSPVEAAGMTRYEPLVINQPQSPPFHLQRCGSNGGVSVPQDREPDRERHRGTWFRQNATAGTPSSVCARRASGRRRSPRDYRAQASGNHLGSRCSGTDAVDRTPRTTPSTRTPRGRRRTTADG